MKKLLLLIISNIMINTVHTMEMQENKKPLINFDQLVKNRKHNEDSIIRNSKIKTITLSFLISSTIIYGMFSLLDKYSGVTAMPIMLKLIASCGLGAMFSWQIYLNSFSYDEKEKFKKEINIKFLKQCIEKINDYDAEDIINKLTTSEGEAYKDFIKLITKNTCEKMLPDNLNIKNDRYLGWFKNNITNINNNSMLIGSQQLKKLFDIIIELELRKY